MRFRMEEAFAFLCDTCYLAYYKTSPDQYFTSNPRPRFFKPPFSLSYKQYRVFLNALKSKETISAFEPGDEVHIGEFYVNSWDAPLAPNPDLSTAFKEIRQFCASIAFFPGVTLLGVDDDLIRRRSKKVEELGFVRGCNPLKGFGPTSHCMLSVLTMMFLGNHIPNCQENQNKSVLLLFMALVGNHVSFEEEIAGKITNLVSFDRGYMTEEMVRKLSFLGIVLLGTLKRCFFFTIHVWWVSCIFSSGGYSGVWASIL